MDYSWGVFSSESVVGWGGGDWGSVQSGLWGGAGGGGVVRGVRGGGARSLWRKSMQYLNCSHISTEKKNSVMRTRMFVHMRTTQAQISTQTRTVWWMQKLSADRIIGYYTMYKWRAKAQTVLWACTSWSASVHFVHIWRHFFFTWHCTNYDCLRIII